MKERIQILFPDGKKAFEGEMKSDSLHGSGQLWYWDVQVPHFDGEWLDNQPNGFGKAFFPNGILCYEGQWKEGKRNGNGRLYDSEGSLVYDGEWKYNDMHGPGKAYDPIHKQLVYVGYFRFGKRTGEGKEYALDGRLVFAGEWKGGKPHGKGVKYHENGLVWYDGSFILGESHGFGQAYYEDGGLAYEGMWKNGLRHGQGKLYDRDGNLEYYGPWNNGEVSDAYPLEEDAPQRDEDSVFLERLAELENGPKLWCEGLGLEVNLKACLSPYFLSFDPTEENWNPFITTLRQFQENPNLSYGDSVLKAYFNAYPRENMQQAFLLSTQQDYLPLKKLKPRAFFPMPWTKPSHYAEALLRRGFIQYKGKPVAVKAQNIREMEKIIFDLCQNKEFDTWVPSKEPGMAFNTRKPPFPEFGPVKDGEGHAVFEKLIRAYCSIRTIGYLPGLFSGSAISGTVLVQGNEYRFVIQEGLFLASALAALGLDKIEVTFSPDDYLGVDKEDLASLPFVRHGVYPLETAQMLFEQAFIPFKGKIEMTPF